MVEKMNCPICCDDNWHQTGIRKQDINDPRWKYGYAKTQKKVFFNIWHPNSSIVVMKRLICKKCGFVVDHPRPDEKDVYNKYEHLAKVEKHLGSLTTTSKKALKQENSQAIEILDLVESYVGNSSKSLDILDYGGGDGHLMVPMKNKGNNCYLVDYNKYPVDGITRLGNTLDDVPVNYKFDLIVCRHVLEHVASPKEMIASFKGYLKKQGCVYAEVPIQLFGRPKPDGDPVTHINFFQEQSFRIMFEAAGFIPLVSRKKPTSYHGEPMSDKAQILAQKGVNNIKILYKNSYEITKAYMFVSFLTRLKKKVSNPINFQRYIIGRLRYIIRILKSKLFL